jgi:hypothetical protein
MSKKQLELSEWQDRLQSFTSGNYHRTVALTVEGSTVFKNAPLVSVDYDPPGKGNALTITIEDYTHIVEAPEKLYLKREANGVDSALEVVSQNGESTLLSLL